MTSTRASHAWAAVLVVVAAAAAVLAWAIPSSTPVAGRLVIVAPPIVSTTLVEQAEALPGGPFEARANDSAARALDDVRRGRADAAIVIDLTHDTDTLYLSDAAGTRGRDALSRAVGMVSSGLGRGVRAEQVSTSHDRRTPYVVVLTSLVLGFLAAVVATWRRGAFETTFAAGTARGLAFGAIGLAAGLACLAWGWAMVPLVGLLVTAAALTTTALEALLGLGGLAASAMLFLLAAGPLGRFTPPLLVPEPWHAITPWFPHGAGLDLASDILLFGGTGSARPWAVVAAWIVLSILTLWVARARRPD